MADKISREKRSANMSKIKGKNTLIEVSFRKQLYKLGLRYSLEYKLFGKPDLVIPTKKIAIFINGCFWHQHQNCKLAYMPKSNTVFWQNKLGKNTERDKKVREHLDKEGWKVITVWECEIIKDMNEIVNKTFNVIKI